MFISLLFSVLALGADLPASILAQQALLTSQGVCETRWKDMGVDAEQKDLGDGLALWLVPCANWADNVAYSVYVTIPESTQADGFITKQMYFITYATFQGVQAGNVIHNVRWDDATQTLSARFFLNGQEQCGSMAEYKWNRGYQNFRLQSLLKNDDCKSTAPWEKAAL